jgi:hypothetical protein
MPDTDYLRWLEAEWNDNTLEPETPVEYRGAMLNAHGLWVVHAQIDDTRYTLRSPDNEHVRLNADRRDLTPLPQGGHDGAS